MALLEIFDPKAAPRPIGIDLGTTNSLVARVRDGRPMVIADCNGEDLLPSVVHYDPRGTVIVGRDAQRLAAAFPRETIVSVKRFMGRGADDPETRRLGTYDFAEPSTPEEAKSARFKVHGRVVTPVEVSAEILRALRALAALTAGFDAAEGDVEKLKLLLPKLGELRYMRRFLDEVSALEEELVPADGTA